MKILQETEKNFGLPRTCPLFSKSKLRSLELEVKVH